MQNSKGSDNANPVFTLDAYKIKILAIWLKEQNK